MADLRRGTALMWRLPLMTSCTEHGCLLEPEPDARLAVLTGGEPRPVPAGPGQPQTAAMNQCTFHGPATGRVSLSAGSVHAGVWFRLLRALLDEHLIGLGIPDEHLPDHRVLGRTDLRP
jgi:hypothetical protein